MNDKLRTVFMVVTVLLFFACLAGMVWAMFIPSVLMCVTCGLLGALFGFFAYTDYVKLFKKTR